MDDKPASTKTIVDSILESLKNKPFVAAVVLIFIILNTAVGFFDRALSILARLGINQPIDQAARTYAIILVVSGAGIAILYYAILSIIRFWKLGDEAVRHLLIGTGIFEHSIKYEVLPVVLCCIFLNFAGFVLNRSLSDLFFFDTLGTFLAAYLLGPYWAGTVGLMSNFAMMLVSPNAFIFGVVNALIGIQWGFIARRLRNPIADGESQLPSIGKQIAIFLIPCVLLSSVAAGIIKTSVYDPNNVLLFTRNLLMVQKWVNSQLYEPGYVSLQTAYIVGDGLRNIVDKLLIVAVGLLILALRCINLNCPVVGVQEKVRSRLPIRDRGRGANVVFVAFSIAFLYFVLPFESVIDRPTGVGKHVHLGFKSWLILSLPLYIALVDMVFHPETPGTMEERNTAKTRRTELYVSRLRNAQNAGVVRWIVGGLASSWTILVLYLICLWAIKSRVVGQENFPIAQVALYLLTVGAGLAAVVILSFIGWLEKD
jgi:hypothetical protein